MDEMNTVNNELVRLARLAMVGKRHDVVLYLRRLIRKWRDINPQVAMELVNLLAESPSMQSPLRDATDQVPVDHDSRLQLARIENPIVLNVEPIWEKSLQRSLEVVVRERKETKALTAAGLYPTKSLLFIGPPGVGKTLAARWLAEQLELPLVVLDLSAVMSSFLGRTGNNLRYVLDYAKGVRCVLLLDEFDAIAKRRDDTGEIGELKRLVTVLLQEIDDFPSTSLLIAATNHAELLDPAVWRRFELILEFPLPDVSAVTQALHEFLGISLSEIRPEILELAAAVFKMHSFSDIERTIRNVKRDSIVSGENLEDVLLTQLAIGTMNLSRTEKFRLIKLLTKEGISQRRISELTGMSRDTLRKIMPLKGKSKL